MITKTIHTPHLVSINNNPKFQEEIKEYFNAKNFKVSVVPSIESAIEEFSKSGSTWDLIVGDVKPTNSHYQALQECIKQLHLNFPIIFMGDNSKEENLVTGSCGSFATEATNYIDLDCLYSSVCKTLSDHTNTKENPQTKIITRSFLGSGKEIIGHSAKFQAALEVARRVAHSNANIFISGESGTGKEVFARFIHDQSKRASGPFIAINCSAIPENLLESELFGHAKGSFTGAFDKKIGLFEEAQNGTLFLDEIGDLTLSLQAKLLRVLQERTIKRVGENQFRPINARIISATHKNLAEEIAACRFREDLFYRLSVIPLMIPALRSRAEDVLPLAEAFLKKSALENDSPAESFSADAIQYLLENQWHGNVRELENAVERAVVLANSTEVTASDFVPSIIQNCQSYQQTPEENTKTKFTLLFKDHLPSLDEAIQKYVEFAVSFNGGAKDRTAREIGIDRKTLYKRLRSGEERQPLHSSVRQGMYSPEARS